MLLAFYFCKVTHFILNNQFFSLFFMNNPKELDSETGHLHGMEKG